MNEGQWATGVPNSDSLRKKFPVVTGPFAPLDFDLLGESISNPGIEVVDTNGVQAVVDVVSASPAHPRRPQTVVEDHNA